jgi:hypothetical protein
MWIEEKRYPEDKELFFKIDIPAFTAELIFKDGIYNLNCEELGIKMEKVDEDLKAAKYIATKLLMYELHKTVHKLTYFMNRIDQLVGNIKKEG